MSERMWKYSCFAEDFKRLCLEKNSDNMIVFDSGMDGFSLSYADVMGLTRRFASWFRENELKEGDTIVGIMPNSPETIVCFFSAMMYGLNYAPISERVSRREFENWISIVHPRLIIRKTGSAEYPSNIKTFECKCNGDFSWLPYTGSDVCISSARIFLMTSGTTGIPKAISIDINKLWSSCKAFVDFYNLQNSQYRFWNYLPMTYLGGLYNLALIPICCRGSFVISEPFTGKTLLNYWSTVARHNISALWFVPSVVQGLVKISNLVKSSSVGHYGERIKIAFLGTAPIQNSMKEEFEKTFGIRLYENFALSETVFLTAENEEDICNRKQGSKGCILPDVLLKFVPVEGIKNINVIWAKTPFLFDGYLDISGKVELETDGEGYFNTNDIGYLDNNNVLILEGRNRDIIKKGGMFVSLVEIENTVRKLAFLEDVVAVPIKHDFYGETYALCVIPRQRVDNDDLKKKIKAWMLENFVAYKMPEEICVYSEFPRTDSGKVLKRVLTRKIEEEIYNGAENIGVHQ